MLNHFRINILLRVIVLLLLMLLTTYSIYENQITLALLAGLFVGIAIASLISYVNQTNIDLVNFFEAIKYNDFTANTATFRKGGHFEELHNSFNMVNQKFLEIRAEKEANHHFLQALIQHIEIGLLCLNEKGEVVLMNEALQKLLHKSYLRNVDGLKKVDEQLWKVVKQIGRNQRELVKVNTGNNLLQLSVQAVDLKLQNEFLRLITFQDIQNELETQELEAWQKLIRILTHEIMNSTAPISSLSATLNSMLADKTELDMQTLDKIKQSLAVIEKRSEGLMAFTETYRALTRIPTPNFQSLDLHGLLDSIHLLMKPDLEKAKVHLEMQFAQEMPLIKGDPHLLEQVFINILKNAVEAVAEEINPVITIRTFMGQNAKVGIQIQDNGIGINREKLSQIFIPFFTTKVQGSGIGLSLSRQIIQSHKGTIEVHSEEGKGTEVIIYL